MKKDSILLLTKDAQCKSYYPVYGGEHWKGKMPNLEELAAKGTVFNHCYTLAPSSNMSYLGVFTMKFPYQQEIKRYVHLSHDYEGDTLFTKATSLGFECHIMWDDSWSPDVNYCRCYKLATIHDMQNLKQAVGSHFLHEGELEENAEREEATFNRFFQIVEEFLDTDKKIFLWCHLPHVLNGRVNYGGDMDLYDRYIGRFRNYFSDENIFISADHGNMNGAKGKVGYGFDVYENAINIPLISPLMENRHVINDNVCNIDFFDLIFNRQVVRREIIFSDSAYYAQPNRKLAIVYGRYRYIYNKINQTEELYDIDWDPHQDFNLIDDYIYDVDRHVRTLAKEYYLYPHWKELPAVRERVRQELLKIWRNESLQDRLYWEARNMVVSTVKSLIRFFK